MNLNFKYSILLLFFASTFFAQHKRVDSLRTVLNSYPKEDSLKSVHYANLSEAFSNISEFDSCIYISKKGLALAEKMNKPRRQIIFLSKIGVALWNKSEYDNAISYYEKGLKLADITKNDNDYSVLYNNIGLAYWDKSDFPKALNYFIRSNEIDSRTNDKEGMSSNLLNIGLVYADMNDHKKALDYYFRAVRLYKDLSDEQSLAIAYTNIGQVYSSMKDNAKSLEYDLMALVIAEKYDDKRNIALANNNIGSVYIETDKKKADYHYNIALKNYESIGDFAGQVLALNNIADLWAGSDRFKEAIQLFERALKIENEYKFVDDEVTTLKGLANAYHGINDYKSAYDNYVRYMQLNDTLSELRNSSEINNIQKSLELKHRETVLNIQKEKELAVKDAEKQKQTFVIIGIFVILALTLVFAVFLLKRIRVTQRQKALIEKQKHIVEEKQKEIVDSIRYAHRIQKALITSETYIKNNLERLSKKD